MATGAGDGLERAREIKPHVVIIDTPVSSGAMALARKVFGEGLGPAFGLVDDGEASPARGDAAPEGCWGVLRLGIHPSDLSSLLETAVKAFLELARLSHEVARLRRALEGRKLVERAKGLLMDRYGLKDADAYRLMQERAMATRRPLSEIARSLIAVEGLAGPTGRKKGVEPSPKVEAPRSARRPHRASGL